MSRRFRGMGWNVGHDVGYMARFLKAAHSLSQLGRVEPKASGFKPGSIPAPVGLECGLQHGRVLKGVIEMGWLGACYEWCPPSR